MKQKIKNRMAQRKQIDAVFAANVGGAAVWQDSRLALWAHRPWVTPRERRVMHEAARKRRLRQAFVAGHKVGKASRLP